MLESNPVPFSPAAKGGPRRVQAGYYLEGSGTSGKGKVWDETKHKNRNYRKWTHQVPLRVCPETYDLIKSRIERDFEDPPPYSALDSNCTTWINNVLRQAGVPVPETIIEPYDWAYDNRAVARNPSSNIRGTR